MKKSEQYIYMDKNRSLSVRQMDVLNQLSLGLSNKQIAYNL